MAKSCKLTPGQVKWLIVISGMLLTSPVSMLSYYGNLLPYLASFFQAHRGSMAYHVSALWPGTIYRITVPLAMLLASPLERRFGIRTCITGGQILVCICVLCGFFAVQEPLALTLVFGFLQGLFSGVSYSLGFKVLLTSVPGNGGFAAGVMCSGPAVGSLVNIGLAYAVINPTNLPADLQIGNTLYFSDPRILDKVPFYFLASGAVTSVATAVGVVFLYIGTATSTENDEIIPSSQKNGGKTHSDSSRSFNVSGERKDNHPGAKLAEYHKPEHYGGCESTSNGEQRIYNVNVVNELSSKHVLCGGFGSEKVKTSDGTETLETKNLLSRGSKITSENIPVLTIKLEAEDQESFGRSQSLSSSQHYNLEFNRENFLERKEATFYCGQSDDKLRGSVQDLGKNDEHVCHDTTSACIDNDCINRRTRMELCSGPCSKKNDPSTNSVPTSKCDLSPWETMQSKRFWWVWISHLCLGHTLYVQTNLYKQYGQLVISSDILLVVTGLLSTALMTIARPAAGAFSDRYGVPGCLVAVCFISSAFMSAMVIGVHTSAALYALASVLEFAAISTIILVYNLIMASLFGRTYLASNLGLAWSAIVANGVTEPFLISWIVDQFGWDWVFLSGSASSAVSMVIALFI